jgi:hypothetical protein
MDLLLKALRTPHCRFDYVARSSQNGLLGCDQRIRPASPGKCAQRGGVGEVHAPTT